MKLVSIALMLLGSLAVLGADTARLDTSSQFRKNTQSTAHIRVKRYRQSMNQGSRSTGCRFGTCTMQKLAHQIYQFTDKDKDGMAPRNKISPQGYGRRRRRSLPEVLRARTVESSQEQTHSAPASPAHQDISRVSRL
ncbi:adrenomedullin, isoform CRA_b [Rattus norvegicus]|uniref:Pro-adrenomedullin n=1 Tax=Rattus norvegicus TaxID=10116 RepID=A6I817_RAT|nr:adrenomedullin, isoform CRA_b [Rattus norvegicus]